MKVSERQIGKEKQAEVQAGANDRSVCGFRLNRLSYFDSMTLMYLI